MRVNQSSKFARFCQWLIQYEWLALALILPLVLFPSPVRALALLLLPALWWVRKVGQGRYVPSTPVDWPMFGLLLMVLVSLYATFDINFSSGKISGLIYGIAVFYAVVAWTQRSYRNLWLGVGFLFAAGWGVVALGLLGTQWTHKFPLLQDVIALLPQKLLILPGAAGGFSPNQLAGVLLWIAPSALLLTLLIIVRMKTLWAQVRPYQAIIILIFTLGTMLVTVGFLFLTQSRGGLFGLATGLFFMLMTAVWHKNHRLFVGLLLLAAIGSAVVANNLEQITPLLFEQTGLNAESNQINTLSGRVEIWSRAIYGIQDFPFTGMGMNNFRRVVPILYPLFSISPDTDIAHAHNHLLQAALDLGIPGLIAYLALWLAMAAMLWQIWRRAASSWLKGLALGFAGSLLAYFVYGITDTVALGAKPGFVFWLLLGLITSLHKLVWEQNTAVSAT